MVKNVNYVLSGTNYFKQDKQETTMTKYTIHTEESAPEGSRNMLYASKGKFGFLPNLLAAQSESPAMLEGYTTLSQIFSKTNFSETERQVILMTNNRLNGCDYCMAAHTTISQMANVPSNVIEALRNGTEIADSKLEALRIFTVQINETRGWVEQGDLDAFFEAGYDKASVLDVILGTSLKVMSNYSNHITQTPVDAAFKANTWSTVDKVAA
jgi:uncharacterized peroxidase-related enzyme